MGLNALIDNRKYFKTFDLIRTWSDLACLQDLYALDHPRTRRKHVRTCQTLWWYGDLKDRHALSSARSMQKKFEPASFKTRKGVKPYYSNIWLKYRHGKHKPTKTKLSKFEIVSPGSSAALNDLLWILLLKDGFTHNRSQRLLKRLPASVQSVIFVKDPRGRLRRAPTSSILSQFSHRAGLSMLAAYTIFAREAIEAEDWPCADIWAAHLFNIFLGLCQDFHRTGIAQPLFQIFENLIFSRTELGTWRSRDFRYADMEFRDAYL